jgi:hypothetical protein
MIVNKKEILMRILSTVFLIALFAIGCSENPSKSVAYGDLEVQAVSSLSAVQLATMIPENTESILLNVVEVSINKTGSDDSTETEDGGWIIISDIPVTVDFLKLSEGVFSELSDVTLEVGKYNQLRLKLGEANEIIIDGVSSILRIPSSAHTGVKLNLNFEITEDSVTEIKVDIRTYNSVATIDEIYILQPTYSASFE